MSEVNTNSRGCFVLFISSIAIIISFVALLIQDAWKDKLTSQTFTIAILSVLVTFLVAWQIWQTMASRQEIKGATIAAKKANRIACKLYKLDKEFREFHGLFIAYRSSSNGLSFLLANKHYRAFHLFATAIVDSLEFRTDSGKCAMGALINLEDCINFEESHESINDFRNNWEIVIARLKDVEDALRKSEQENAVFQAMAKHHINKFKEAARAKGFNI